MHQHHDAHAHRDPDFAEEPFDAANQSLADALRASFWILKLLMVVLVVFYLISNIGPGCRGLESHEQALVLRLGRLLPEVHKAGLVWALPYPLDEIVRLPTRKSNDLLVESHTFRRSEEEKGKPLSFLSRGPHQGLSPSDGALLTADSGLVHVQWKITYKIKDVSSYVQELTGAGVETAENLIRTLVESVGIHVASQMTAEQMIRTRVDDVQTLMRERINQRLRALSSGIHITFVEMHEPTPPLQVRTSFDATQKAESTKERKIRHAEQEATKILSEAAGAAYPRVVALLDAIDAGGTEDEPVEILEAKLDDLLDHEAEGEAGRMIKDAGVYLSNVVGRMKSDVELYQTLVPEYERQPALLIERLWEQVRLAIFDRPGVIKIYRPPGCEFRLHIPLDPEQTRIDEEQRLLKKTFDPGSLRPETLHPIGVGYD